MAALGWYLNVVNFAGDSVGDDPAGDGVFGQLMLVGVGRIVIPFVWTGIAWEMVNGWL